MRSISIVLHDSASTRTSEAFSDNREDAPSPGSLITENSLPKARGVSGAGESLEEPDVESLFPLFEPDL